MATRTVEVEHPGLGIRARHIIAVLLLAPVLAHLAYGIANSPLTNYYVTVDELAAKGTGSASASQIRVGAPIVPGSIRWDNGARTLTFQMEGTIRPLDVVYRGLVPDSFRDGATAIVEGTQSPDGSFSAFTLLVKCPHDYVPGV